MNVTAPVEFRAPGHACDAECWYARGPVTDCICSCGGECHGIRRAEWPLMTAAQMAAEPAPARDPFARIPAAIDDDEWAF